MQELERKGSQVPTEAKSAAGKDTISARKQHSTFNHFSHDAPYWPHVNWKQKWNEGKQENRNRTTNKWEDFSNPATAAQGLQPACLMPSATRSCSCSRLAWQRSRSEKNRLHQLSLPQRGCKTMRIKCRKPNETRSWLLCQKNSHN